VVHARTRKHPPQQAAFPPFTFTCSSRAQAQQRQQPVPPLPKTGGGGLFADFSSAAAGLDAPRDNADLDDTVPWIHYPIPIVDEASPAAPALADSFIPDFFSELHAAAATTSLGPLPPPPPPPPPPVQHTGGDDDDNRSTPVPNPSTGRGPEPTKETHRAPVLPGPAGRPEPPQGPQAELAPARKPRPESGGGEGLMNFSIFSRPAAMARASLRQRPPHTGTDKASNNNATTSTRVESTVLQSASGSGPRTATAPALFVDQRTAWPSQQPKDVRFPCAAAAPPPTPPPTAANLQQERPSNNNMTPPQKEVETRKASEAAGATATSSVCSGNGAGTGKDDESWRQQKRKSLQAECSASQDDVSRGCEDIAHLGHWSIWQATPHLVALTNTGSLLFRILTMSPVGMGCEGRAAEEVRSAAAPRRCTTCPKG
jgi:phytochrome-interacting factor 3